MKYLVLTTMQKFITTFLFCFILTQVIGQTQRKVSVYLQAQFNQTLYDITVPNNPMGVGFGLQAYLNNSSKIRPTIDFTADAYGPDDKVQRLYPDGTPIDGIEGMVNLFAGASYQSTNRVYLSFVAGPSFIIGQTLLGIKPSVGVYFSRTQRLTAKVSYINIFNRDKRTNEDFGALSFSLGVRLY
jgi:hypothetical protein